MGILWCEAHLKSYNPLSPNQGLMEKIASLLRLVRLTALTFLMCVAAKKSQSCKTAIRECKQNQHVFEWRMLFKLERKNPRDKQRKAWTKSTSLHSNQDCISEKIWERRASLNFCKWNWKKRMWGACMSVCFTLIDQWQAPGIW